MHDDLVQLDPLESPHPIPWSWVMAMLSSASSSRESQVFYYRSQSLVSPDGRYAAYSRIQMQVDPEFFRSQVSSVLFLENLRTGDLQAITPAAPLANNPLAESISDRRGTISIVIPVAWSETGDRLLAREFESIFCSDIASDYAVVVDCHQPRVSTVAPSHIHYTNAVLLGWSQNHPGCVLFRAGVMGEPDWPLWAVDISGRTVASKNDQPITHGEVLSNVWAGPQQAKLAG